MADEIVFQKQFSESAPLSEDDQAERMRLLQAYHADTKITLPDRDGLWRINSESVTTHSGIGYAEIIIKGECVTSP